MESTISIFNVSYVVVVGVVIVLLALALSALCLPQLALSPGLRLPTHLRFTNAQ